MRGLAASDTSRLPRPDTLLSIYFEAFHDTRVRACSGNGSAHKLLFSIQGSMQQPGLLLWLEGGLLPHASSGANPNECVRRFTNCLKSRCYFFNSPKARCKNNAEDMALTLSCQRSAGASGQMPDCAGVTCTCSLRNCREYQAKGMKLNCKRDAATCRKTGVWPPNKYMAGAFAKGCRAKRE